VGERSQPAIELRHGNLPRTPSTRASLTPAGTSTDRVVDLLWADVRAVFRPERCSLPADAGPPLSLPLEEAHGGPRPPEARAARERLRLHHRRRGHGQDDPAAHVSRP